jgi:hypothetical protein
MRGAGLPFLADAARAASRQAPSAKKRGGRTNEFVGTPAPFI